jgi:chemotaxis protein MotB
VARKKKHPEHNNHERWLVSYADFITLLFAFFVVMFASSQADKGKAQQVSEAVKKALEGQRVAAVIAAVLGGTADTKGQGNAQMKGPGGIETRQDARPLAELLPSLQILSKELEEEIKAGEIQINMEARGLVISFAQAALFPSGEDVISADALPGLGKVAAAIAQVPNPVRLEGHTDSRPIHTARFHSNWDLSAARSIALLKILSERFGLPATRLSVAGYADTAPVAANDTEEGRTRNRRVDIVVLNQQGMQGEPLKTF